MRISAIIPSHNCAAFVGEAIRSVLSQSRQVHELIVIDDGSTDDTASVVRRFGEALIYIRTDNQGVAAARNAGLTRATGDCVAFLDADDAWYPRKLELQTRVLEAHPPVQAVCSDFDLVDHTGALVQERFVKDKYRVFRAHGVDWPDVFPERLTVTGGGGEVDVFFGDAFPVLFRGNFVNTSSMLIRRAAIDAAGRFTATRLTQEDYELWLKLALRGPMAYVDGPLLFFRRRPDQLTRVGRNTRIAQDVADVVMDIAEPARQRLGEREVARRVSEVLRRLASAHLGSRQPIAARRVLARSYATVGLDLRAVPLYCWTWVPAALSDGLRRVLRRVRGQPRRTAP